MTTRFLPLLLLLSQAIPAGADLKIVTHRGTSSDTLYVQVRGSQARNSRSEFGDAFGPQAIWIFNGDRQLQYGLDPSTRTYTAHRVEPWKPNPLLRVPESGKAIDIYRDYVDTGERRWMFGHLARHVILSGRWVPEAGSCSAKQGELRTKTDGWYVDLPGPFKGAALFGVDHGVSCPNGAQDSIAFHTTGTRETGYPLLETVTRTDSKRVISRKKVVAWDESPLDPKTFLPPGDFHQVPSLPNADAAGNRRRDVFLDNVRERLSGFVLAAEDLLE